MPVPKLDDLFEIGADVLGSSYAGNKTILLQTGSSVLEEVKSNNVELYGPSGYFGRPAKAIQGESAPQSLTITQRDHDIAFGFRDVRSNDLIEQLGFGEVQVYASGPENKKICKIVLNNDGEDAQKITLTVKDTKIEILSDGTVNVNAKKVNLAAASDFVALSQKVDSNFNAVATTFGSLLDSTSSKVTAGSPFIPSSTAAADTKAS